MFGSIRSDNIEDTKASGIHRVRFGDSKVYSVYFLRLVPQVVDKRNTRAPYWFIMM